MSLVSTTAFRPDLRSDSGLPNPDRARDALRFEPRFGLLLTRE